MQKPGTEHGQKGLVSSYLSSVLCADGPGACRMPLVPAPAVALILSGSSEQDPVAFPCQTAGHGGELDNPANQARSFQH